MLAFMNLFPGLPSDGPTRLALKAFGNGAGQARDAGEGSAMRAPILSPVPFIEAIFTLAGAARADQKDDLVFNGVKGFELQGLLNAKGVHTCKLLSWKSVDVAVDNILEGVNKLDLAGFLGPYALALSPPLFNLLFRRYPQGNQTELEHLQQAVPDGIVKTSAVENGGVLVTSVKELAAIVIGQALTTAFIGPKGRDYEFSVSESAALRLIEPASVCVFR